jgi:hypothetical protein
MVIFRKRPLPSLCALASGRSLPPTPRPRSACPRVIKRTREAGRCDR